MAAAIGTINGKGDLIVCDNTTGTWTVALGTGGDFLPTGYTWLTGFAVGPNYSLRSADFNGDGLADILAKDSTGASSKVYVELNNGNKFVNGSIWLSNWKPGIGYNLLTGDFNGDGKSDILAKEIATGNWFVSLSTGSSFAASTSWSTNILPGSGISLIAADVDGDKKCDIIAVLPSGVVYISKSLGNYFGNFTAVRQTVPPSSGVSYLAADVTGDGKADFITKDNNGDWTVCASTGSGFALPVSWGTGFALGAGYYLAAFDVTGDGKADIVASDPVTGNPGRWYIWESDGTKFFNGRVALDNFAAGTQYTRLIGDAFRM